MNILKCLVPVALFSMVACTESIENKSTPSSSNVEEKVLVLDWSDLEPEGEVERLEQAYEEYFDELENKVVQNSSVMTSLGPSSIDNIAEGSAFDSMPQLGSFNTVMELDGKRVRLPGFIVPLDYQQAGELTEFLLVPYYGACIHTPPPPPYQIVYVQGKVAFEGDAIFLPYWAEGTLATSANYNDMGNAAYTLQLDKLSPYE